jgi:hypothetical protein
MRFVFLVFLIFCFSCNKVYFRCAQPNHDALTDSNFYKKWCGATLLKFVEIPSNEFKDVCVNFFLGKIKIICIDNTYKCKYKYKCSFINEPFKFIDSLTPDYQTVVNQSWFQGFKGLSPRQSFKLHYKRFERIKHLNPMFIPLYSYEFLVKINNQWFIYSTLTDQFYDDLYICGLFKWIPQVTLTTQLEYKDRFGNCDCFSDFYLRSNSVAYPKL